MDKPCVLVTGGAGFIGSHVCKALSRANIIPVTMDNLVTGHRFAVKWGPFVEGDVSDQTLVEYVIRNNNVTAVMHFAALSDVGLSNLKPDLYYHNNIGGMLSLMEACKNTGVKKFIFSSSCAVYGMPETVPISEDFPQAPINPYGWTKLICEKMLKSYARTNDINAVILRYFNACGADPEGELGEFHEPENHLIPNAIMAAMGEREYLEVYGNDYETPDGTCIRDYIHVHDLALAHIKAYDHLVSGGKGIDLNVGSGVGYSVLEIIDAIEDALGRKTPHEFKQRREGDTPVLCAEISKSRKILEFQASMSDLSTIVNTAAKGLRLKSQLV
ncbi:MAG: UDP-glucose 4-epimerase GalE [Pseudomonadota bacterium]